MTHAVVLDGFICCPYVARDSVVPGSGSYTYHLCTNGRNMHGSFESVAGLADYLTTQKIGNLGIRNFPEKIENGGFGETRIYRGPLDAGEMLELRTRLKQGLYDRGIIECCSASFWLPLKESA